MDNIHTRIKALRLGRKLSMQALADACQVTWQTVQQWEQPNGTAPKRARLEAVAKALGTTTSYLISGLYPEASEQHRVEQPRPTYKRESSAVAEIMAMLESTDEVGRSMALAAVKVALSGHKAIKANRRA